MDLYFRHIPEHVVPGRRLGRNVLHDPRSLNYQVLVSDTTPIASKTWRRYTPVLDQGNIGSCTGNAACGSLGTTPLYGALAARRKAGLVLNEDEALRLYSSATQLDPFAGTFTYPPPGGQDTGSNGLSVAKAAQKAGLISGYRHAMSLAAMQAALQVGSVIVGTNWYDSFDQPDMHGLVTISKDAQVRGGHQWEVRGLDMSARLFHATNSWGTSWGVNGTFSISFDDMARLLSEQGDCTQFVPIGASAITAKPGLFTRIRERLCA